MIVENNKYKITGPVSKPPRTGGNYAFLSVKAPGEKFESYVEFAGFDSDIIASVERLREGDVVTVTGHVSMRKNKESGKFETQLIMTGIKADEAMAKVKAVFPDAREVTKAPF